MSGHLIHEPLELLRTILGFHVLQYFGLVGGGWVGETCLLEDVFFYRALTGFLLPGLLVARKKKRRRTVHGLFAQTKRNNAVWC